jgi:hypothetical protein
MLLQELTNLKSRHQQARREVRPLIFSATLCLFWWGGGGGGSAHDDVCHWVNSAPLIHGG